MSSQDRRVKFLLAVTVCGTESTRYMLSLWSGRARFADETRRQGVVIFGGWAHGLSCFPRLTRIGIPNASNY